MLVDINRLISAGKCGDAEAFARLSVRPPLLHTILGFYKGIDGYTADTRIELTAKAVQSPYRWWFETLRCSRDYWWVCQQGGKTLDPDLHRVWQHFGDVFTTYFETWWNETGHRLFAEQIGPPRIERLNGFVVEQYLRSDNYLVLAVPMLMPDKVLKAEFTELLEYFRGREVRKSDALFPLKKTKRIRLGVIEKALQVWLYRDAIDRGSTGKDDGSESANAPSLYEIGELLEVSPKHRKRPGESILVRKKKERVMRVAVSRATDRASKLISNAEMGIFPSFEQTQSRERWTPRQAQALQRALRRGDWKPPGFSTVDLPGQWDPLKDWLKSWPYGI